MELTPLITASRFTFVLMLPRLPVSLSALPAALTSLVVNASILLVMSATAVSAARSVRCICWYAASVGLMPSLSIAFSACSAFLMMVFCSCILLFRAFV